MTSRYIDEREDKCSEGCLNDCEAMEFSSEMRDASARPAHEDNIGGECTKPLSSEGLTHGLEG